MDKFAKKKLSSALIVPFLSYTMLNVSTFSVSAQTVREGNFMVRMFSDHKDREMPVLVAAATMNPTVSALEEEVRQLTGKVEELNFMLLQMQTQIDDLRKAGTSGKQEGQMPAPANTAHSNGTTAKTGRPAAPANGSAGDDAQAEKLGSVRFDQQGNAIGADKTTALAATVPAGGNVIATVPQTASARELYKIGYQHVLAGDYRAAESVFRAFQERYATDPLIGDASFWLGEALYGQGRYREAAQVYIDVQRKYNGSERGPENLLKLGMSMALLDEKDVACATLAEVPKRYKKAEPAVLKRASDERSRIKCP